MPSHHRIPAQVLSVGTKRAEHFIKELSGRPELDSLSRTPLFLVLLIYLKYQNATLPRRRFDAYHSLVEHLVVHHPTARRQAASVVAMPVSISPNETQDLMARLGFWVQSNAPNGIISNDDLRSVVRAYLEDDAGLGLTPGESRRLTDEIDHSVADSVGLLVRQGLTHLSFFHRSLQEYLAAWYASRLSHNEQLASYAIERRIPDGER